MQYTRSALRTDCVGQINQSINHFFINTWQNAYADACNNIEKSVRVFKQHAYQEIFVGQMSCVVRHLSVVWTTPQIVRTVTSSVNSSVRPSFRPCRKWQLWRAADASRSSSLTLNNKSAITASYALVWQCCYWRWSHALVMLSSTTKIKVSVSVLRQKVLELSRHFCINHELILHI